MIEIDAIFSEISCIASLLSLKWSMGSKFSCKFSVAYILKGNCNRFYYLYKLTNMIHSIGQTVWIKIKRTKVLHRHS